MHAFATRYYRLLFRIIAAVAAKQNALRRGAARNRVANVNLRYIIYSQRRFDEKNKKVMQALPHDCATAGCRFNRRPV
jgi:hypothetical protein